MADTPCRAEGRGGGNRGDRVLYVPTGEGATVYTSAGRQSYIFWDDEGPDFHGSVVADEDLRLREPD
jgi:hypothetical protein